MNGHVVEEELRKEKKEYYRFLIITKGPRTKPLPVSTICIEGIALETVNV